MEAIRSRSVRKDSSACGDSVWTLPQTPLEDAQNGRDLLLHALMRFVDPEQALFQFRASDPASAHRSEPVRVEAR